MQSMGREREDPLPEGERGPGRSRSVICRAGWPMRRGGRGCRTCSRLVRSLDNPRCGDILGRW